MKEEPLVKYEAFLTAFWVSLRLIVYYGIALGIWGLVFKKSILWFGLYGAIAGLLISLLFAAPVIAAQKTKGRVRDMVFGANFMWLTLGTYIGILGIIALIIRIIFF